MVDFEYVVGMAMRVHENCSGKYMSNTNIGKGLVVISTGWQGKMNENHDHQNKTVLVLTF